jgi:hypothetical protein
VAVELLGTKFYVSNFIAAALLAGCYIKIELIKGVAFCLFADTPPTWLICWSALICSLKALLPLILMGGGGLLPPIN